MIIGELLGLELGAPPVDREAEREARRAARQEAIERDGRLATARSYSAYGRGLASILERE